MADLYLQGISKVYGSRVQAVFPLDLEVKNGTLVALVGPSGCGKSTLLKIIAGLERATTGSILLDGKRVDHASPAERDVAMVFQSYALYPHLTVRKNIEFGLRMHRVPAPRRQEEVNSVATLLGLEPLLDRRPHELSGGQQQRVALGRAIVRRPKVFLLDEPFSNLDATLRAGTRTELLRLHRQLNATTVLVTHDQVEAMTMADVLVVMKDGRVEQTGAPLEVYRNPATRFVAEFIGYPPMNVLPAVVSDSGAVLEIAGQQCPNPFPGMAAKKFALGLRAEDIQAEPANGSPLNRQPGFFAELALLESLGHEAIGTCLASGHDVRLRLPVTSGFQLGQNLKLTFNPDDAKLFDIDTQQRLRVTPRSFQAAAGCARHEVTLQNDK